MKKHDRRRKKRRFFLFKLYLLFCIAMIGICIGYQLLKEQSLNDDLEPIVFSEAEPVSEFQNPEVKNALLFLANENENAQKILDNIGEYPERLLKMLVTTPEAIDFVADYPNEKDKAHEISIEDTYQQGSIPLYIQWDKQWGYDSYGDGMIALDGCGPTCLSMVYVGLTCDTSLNPKEMAEYSEAYLVDNMTSWELMTDGAQRLGLISQELSLDSNIIRRELNEGHPIICSMRPGDFTTTGHFIVLTGIADNGEITVNDPNSPMRSQKTWDLDTILWQIKNLWSFSY